MPEADFRGSTCTMQLRGGRFCDKPADIRFPHRICSGHAIAVFLSVKEFLSDRDQIAKNLQEYALAEHAAYKGDLPDLTPKIPGSNHVIYYLRVGALIKIGYTHNLSQRLTQYPPDTELLITEDARVIHEADRLRQFNQYLVYGREWFTPGETLMIHIAQLQAKPVLQT